MDESQYLEALASVLNALSDNPFDLSLHQKHIKLAQSTKGMEEQAVSAMEMFTNVYAAGDDTWLHLIPAKKASVDLGTLDGLAEVLALYERAEEDYLSIPVLGSHIDFLLEQYARYSEGEMKPEELGDLFSVEWTREALAGVVNKGLGHLTQSNVLWDKRRDWELELLERASAADKELLEDVVQKMLLERLQQPHSNSDETFQTYSTFTTNHRPPEQYEDLMVSASRIRSRAVKDFARREPKESAILTSNFPYDAYAQYIRYERNAKRPDLLVMGAVYERAIATAAKCRANAEDGAEEALRIFWTGYIDAVRIYEAGQEVEFGVLQRAVRSVPGCGEVWARYIRHLEKHAADDPDASESVADIYNKAFGTGLIEKDVEQIVPVVLARAGYDRRCIEAEQGDESSFATLAAVVEGGIEMVRKASPTGDSKLRLEKFLSELYRSAGVNESAIAVWRSATTAKAYKSSYLAWTYYTDLLSQCEQEDETRSVFQDVHTRNIDWPEAIWEAWISFEHIHGSVDEVNDAMDKIEKAQGVVNHRRAKEAQKASYQASQIIAEASAASVPVSQAPTPSAAVGDSMDVDETSADVSRGTKRRADEMSIDSQNKKIKTETPAPPKRDRENSTVFVAALPSNTQEGDLKDLFRDCGKIREVKITQLPSEAVATVEFEDRESVLGALTKDKKRISDQEIDVHLAWKSTLYVTNFPEATDDATIRRMFGKYGTIFDVRWPSKKFKNTRRFCYIQFTLSTSAETALELHGSELAGGQSLNVFISNPDRKKARTDQDADEREVYVAGLNKFTSKEDLEKVFRTYGPIKEVRMVLEKNGQSKGFAFVEYDDAKSALAALAANNHELKNRRIAVTLSDSRAKGKTRHGAPETGLGQKAELRSRTLRIRKLPADTQEGLLQQAVEKLAPIKRLEVFADTNEAVIELESAAEAGKLLLSNKPVDFGGLQLRLEEDRPTKSGPAMKKAAPSGAGDLFVPRPAGSKPRAGLGHKKTAGKPAFANPPAAAPEPSGPTTRSATSSKKGQDDFRKLLGGQK